MVVKEEFDKFTLEEAENLVSSIEVLGDIRNVKVVNPSGSELEKITLKAWVTWLVGWTQKYGSNSGIERQFLNVIETIDQNNLIMVERAKEAIRRVLAVVDKQELTIKNLKTKITDLKRDSIPISDFDRLQYVIQPQTKNEAVVDEKPKAKPFQKKKAEDYEQII